MFSVFLFIAGLIVAAIIIGFILVMKDCMSPPLCQPSHEAQLLLKLLDRIEEWTLKRDHCDALFLFHKGLNLEIKPGIWHAHVSYHEVFSDDDRKHLQKKVVFVIGKMKEMKKLANDDAFRKNLERAINKEL